MREFKEGYSGYGGYNGYGGYGGYGGYEFQFFNSVISYYKLFIGFKLCFLQFYWRGRLHRTIGNYDKS